MKAVEIIEHGGPDCLQEVELPLPEPSRNQVRVKICAIGCNPVDAKMRSGHIPIPFPAVLGVDFSGVVDAKGDLVRDFEIGDPVFGVALGGFSNGSYAEYLCIHIAFLAKKPDKLSFEHSAALGVAYLTAFQALIGTEALQKNRPLFIAGGSGGVGSAAIQLVKAHGGGPIFTLSGSESSRKYLTEIMGLPSSQILDYAGLSVEEMASRLIEMNRGSRFYFTLDFVGGKAKELCIELADFHGHVASVIPEDCLLGFEGREHPFWIKSLSLHGIMIYAEALGGQEHHLSIYHSQLFHIAQLLKEEKIFHLETEEIGSFSVETIRKAHQRLEEGHTQGKLVISFE